MHARSARIAELKQETDYEALTKKLMAMHKLDLQLMSRASDLPTTGTKDEIVARLVQVCVLLPLLSMLMQASRCCRLPAFCCQVSTDRRCISTNMCPPPAASTSMHTAPLAPTAPIRSHS